MITVGFTLIGRGAWSGGEAYQRNLLGVLARELAGEVQARLFLTPAQHERIGDALDPFLAGPAIVDPRVEGAGEGRRMAGILLRGRDAAFADLVAEHPVDVMFQSAQWLGERFPVPLVSWIPDFQHRRLPHLFSLPAWARRDLGFRLQTSSGHLVMLSSQDARLDCETFYPAARGRTRVAPFAIDLDPAPVLVAAGQIRAVHGLPDRFFYLPNQFWRHKNHTLVLEALRLLSVNGRLSDVPPVIMTGRTEDPRDPGLFARTMGQAADLGLDSHFRHLGLVSYGDVFALNAAADALINPSLFEGWSTPVEEAKALGTPLLLSDLRVHREQAPEAAYFPIDDAWALAERMLDTGRAGPPQRPAATLLVTRQAERRAEYARALKAVFESAVAERGPLRLRPDTG